MTLHFSSEKNRGQQNFWKAGAKTGRAWAP